MLKFSKNTIRNIVLLCLFGLIVYIYVPFTLVKEPTELKIYGVFYHGEKVDVSNIDKNVLNNIVCNMKFRRICWSHYYTPKKNDMEIYFAYKGKFYHILFGKYDFCYYDTGLWGALKLIDANNVENEIEKILQCGN